MDEFNLHYGSYDAATGKKMVSASTQSLVTSIINAGEFIGAATAFLISERIGLRGGLLASCVIVAIGTTLQVAVPDVGCLIAGRLVLGRYWSDLVRESSEYAVGKRGTYTLTRLCSRNDVELPALIHRRLCTRQASWGFGDHVSIRHYVGIGVRRLC